jgi:anti-sigma-K factor RskA
LTLRRLPATPEPSPQFEQRFYARLAGERARPGGLWERLSWRILAPAVAAGAVAAAAVLLAGAPGPEPGQLLLAENLELLESYDLVALSGEVDPGDAELLAHLDELEGRP